MKLQIGLIATMVHSFDIGVRFARNTVAKRSLALIFICIVVGAVPALASEIRLPSGTLPEIDGVVSDGEWDDALVLPLQGGKGLLVKRSGEYLCVAIQGAKGGIGSLGLCIGDSLRILHASTGLITAEYVKSPSSWLRTADFRGPEVEPGVNFARGEVRQGARYREANLVQFDWTANVVELGPPENMEFIVRLGEQTECLIGLSVVFLQMKATSKYAVAPPGLSDASTNRALVAGTANAEMKFDPNEWLSVVWSSKSDMGQHLPKPPSAHVASAGPALADLEGEANDCAETLNIPQGRSITADGTEEAGEWNDALGIDFKGGDYIKVKHDGEHLFLSIKGEKLGICSVAIHAEDEIKILHASAGLITAVYEKSGGHWEQTEEFRSERQEPLRRAKTDADKMAMKLAQYKWCANIQTRKGPADFDVQNITEYMISLDLLRNEMSTMSVVFSQRTAREPLARAPRSLDDDCLMKSMVHGENIRTLDFMPDTWLRLKW